jgi:hypothetical protein
MKRMLTGLTLAAGLAGAAVAQELVDMGFASGWNIMMDPAMGNGCLIETVYQDLSVVRLGYDGTTQRAYFVVFNKGWGTIETGESYPITFDLDGERFDAVAKGLHLNRVPGAIVFFDDRGFVDAIARRQHMTVYTPEGETVMRIDLSGTADALKHARDCQRNAG